MEETKNFIGRFLFILACSFYAVNSFAQPDSLKQDSAVDFIKNNPETILQIIVIDGDTIPWTLLDEVLFVPTPTFSDNEARKRYFILKRKVIKVYPYAYLAGDKLDSVNLELMNITKKRKRKKYIKKYQNYLEEKFEPELRKLTRSEGQILCKLMYRETGMTVYQLIKEYRSGWNAWWWNRLANWYDIELDTPYDPENVEEDALIENILTRAFNERSLKERVPFYPPAEESQ